MVPLDLYYSSERQDYQTCGTSACRADASPSLGYVHVRRQCYVAQSAVSMPYALPSIARNDPAFGDQMYWRGRIWGPMVQLVYWALDRYSARSIIVKRAQNSLVDLSRALLLNEWRSHRHVHENYSGINGEGCDVQNSDPFYHWGALTGFISILNEN